MVDRKTELKKNLESLVRAYYEARTASPFELGRSTIPLSVPTIEGEETWAVLETLLDGGVTMGPRVRTFEKLLADYINVQHAVMVNSGSSANLLALSVLTNPALKDHLRPGDEVITPAVTWATTVFPIIQCGLEPVLVDVEPATFNVDLAQVEDAISSKTKAIMLVHLLGNPCPMRRMMDLAERHNLYVIEDCCEAHGAEYEGRKVGSFGHLATLSFYFSHHISTIEGGMVLTNDDGLAELTRALRVFGWIRDLREKDALAQRYPVIDARYLFANIGYNFRPTELQGAIGQHQLPKLEGFIKIRRENAAFWTEQIAAVTPHLLTHKERPGTRHVWFGYPLIVAEHAPFTRQELVRFLEEKGVETRPIMSGNVDEQPAMRLFPYRRVGDLSVARFIHRNAFFFGNHQGIGRVEREAIVTYLKEFLAGR